MNLLVFRKVYNSPAPSWVESPVDLNSPIPNFDWIDRPTEKDATTADIVFTPLPPPSPPAPTAVPHMVELAQVLENADPPHDSPSPGLESAEEESNREEMSERDSESSNSPSSYSSSSDDSLSSCTQSRS
jgi:hypothetical protein